MPTPIDHRVGGRVRTRDGASRGSASVGVSFAGAGAGMGSPPAITVSQAVPHRDATFLHEVTTGRARVNAEEV